jgi:hypothetical protein
METSQNAALNVIKQAKTSKAIFVRHSNIMKPVKKGSIENITIPVPHYSSMTTDSDTIEWETIEDEETIFSLLLRKNA